MGRSMLDATRTDESLGGGKSSAIRALEAFVRIATAAMCNSVRISRMMLNDGKRAIVIVAAGHDRWSDGQLGVRCRRVQIGARHHRAQMGAHLSGESTGAQIGARSANTTEYDVAAQFRAGRAD